MCGLAGFWDTNNSTSQDQLLAIVTQMRDTLIHRGPDDAGNWADAATGIALAQRRLSILDLSVHGHQPMSSYSGRYVIIFNGEIYNHAVIRQQLAAAGQAPVWQGHSDTEVMLASFEAWGIEYALKQMVGMFAIALWDRQQKLLHLVRDRLGEKPLYYGWLQNTLVFASELKAIHAHPNFKAQINPQAVDLLLQYNCIPAPFTIYSNIHKLLPGHILTIAQNKSVPNKCATAKPYWQLKEVINDSARHQHYTNPEHAVDNLQQVLGNAVADQMLADVPVGAFLSGGIDSATVVSLMQSQSKQPIKTFTIGFNEKAYNEAEYAKAVAQHLRTDHTELYVDAAATRAVIPDLANLYDEPFADSSQLPTYLIAKLARQHVTVALSGDGGDELFAGYNRYKLVPAIWQKISLLPKPLRVLFKQLILAVPPRHWNKLLGNRRNYGDKLHKLAPILAADSPMAIFQKLISQWDANDTTLLPDLTKDLNNRALTEIMMYVDTMRYLPDDILVKVDRAAMANSLEIRTPFLDHRVVEFAWSLPLDLKMRAGQSKWIVRKLLNRYVPEKLYERPKMGFGVPIEQWLRGPLREWAQDLLTTDMLAKHNLLNNNLVQQKWREHSSGQRNWQHHLWGVLVFQAWYEAHHG